MSINTLDMSIISANSDVTGDNYYSLKWKNIMDENNEAKVLLSDVEVHKVEFEF